MGRCCKKYLNKMLDAYQEELADISKAIQKNFEDMDFENAKTREDMELIVGDMRAACEALKSTIESQKV
ncbi:MAG: hypothetical protein GX284_15455 [Clostridiales bacterium]|nr:hypothetical protein [Clostridiales bacterium]